MTIPPPPQSKTPSPSLTVLTPPTGSRTILIGTTGSGKSVLMRKMLSYLRNQHIVIIDPKHEITWTEAGGIDGAEPKDAGFYGSPKALMSKWGKRVRIYRPTADHLSNRESWEEVFRFVFARKNTVLAIDELYQVVNGPTSFPRSLQAIYTQGRSKGITVLACVQRPSGVPLWTISESGRVALFEVAIEEDRARVASATQAALRQNVADIDGYNGHYFWWFARGPKARASVLYCPM